ncbi:MAG: hypothetical protein ACF8NJ_09500, partial [Phycisphaerales bacterium JB038]
MSINALRYSAGLAAMLAVASAAVAETNSIHIPSLPGLNVNQTAEFVPGEIIITFENVPTPAELDNVMATYGVTAVRSMRHAPHPVNDPTGVHPLAKVRVITLP